MYRDFVTRDDERLAIPRESGGERREQAVILALLLCEPLLEVVLFVAYGHYTLRRLDGHAAHRLTGAPRPPKPPRHGLPRALHEGRLWLRTVLAAAVACALLQGAIRYVGDAGRIDSLRPFQWVALRAVAIHGLIALSYVVFPKRWPPGTGEGAGPMPMERIPR